MPDERKNMRAGLSWLQILWYLVVFYFSVVVVVSIVWSNSPQKLFSRHSSLRQSGWSPSGRDLSTPLSTIFYGEAIVRIILYHSKDTLSIHTPRQKWDSQLVTILNTARWDKNLKKLNHMKDAKNIDFA